MYCSTKRKTSNFYKWLFSPAWVDMVINNHVLPSFLFFHAYTIAMWPKVKNIFGVIAILQSEKKKEKLWHSRAISWERPDKSALAPKLCPWPLFCLLFPCSFLLRLLAYSYNCPWLWYCYWDRRFHNKYISLTPKKTDNICIIDKLGVKNMILSIHYYYCYSYLPPFKSFIFCFFFNSPWLRHYSLFLLNLIYRNHSIQPHDWSISWCNVRHGRLDFGTWISGWQWVLQTSLKVAEFRSSLC